MFLKVLEEKNLHIDEYVLFSSALSAGKSVTFLGKEYIFNELNENKIAIRFSTRNLDKSGKIINIPIFMAEYIDKFIELGIN